MRLALYPLVQQFQYRNGTNLVAGKIYVYYRGRTRLATIYKDQNGTIAQNPLTCDADGRAPCFVDTNYQYTIVVCDARGKELFSQDLDADNAININDALSGDSKLYIINSDGTISVNATSGDTWIQYDLGTFNKPLGVQAPLYWAQDDEECSIIGASGLATSEELSSVSSIVDEKLDTTAFSEVSGSFITAHQSLDGLMSADLLGYNNKGRISGYNGSAFAGQGGSELSAGDYIDITDDIISVTGLQPTGDYVVHDEMTAYATQDDLSSVSSELDQKIDTKLDESAFSEVSGDFYTNDNPSGFINSLPEDLVYSSDIEDVVRTGDITDVVRTGDITDVVRSAELETTLEDYQPISGMTAYQPVGDYQTAGNYQTAGDYYSASNPSGFLVPDDITGKQDITGMTAYQLSGDYATNTQLSEVSSTITAMIPSGEYELVGGDNIELVDDPIEKTTTINVTGLHDWTPDIESAVSSKLDTTAFSDVSGTFLTAHQDLSDYQTIEGMTAYQPVGDYQTAGDYYSASNPSGFITGVDLSDYALSADVSSELANKLDTTAFSTVSGDFLQANDITGKQDIEGMTAYQTVEGMTAYQPTGDYLTTADSANFYTTANESGFITGVDLTPYQLTADMTAYQPVGDYLSATESANYLLTSDSANFYTTANESGYLTAVPDTYLQNTDLTIVDNKITEISGVPLSAGDELPAEVSGATDYIVANSAQIDNTVNCVSASSGAWGGEGIPVSGRNGIDFEQTDDVVFFGASALENDISDLSANKLDVSAFSEVSGDFYTTANESGFINEIPDTYLQNTDLTLVDNKITEISGIPLSAGTELEFQYDSENAISSINNSALSDSRAGTPLYVESPLFTGQSGDSAYIGSDINETILFSGADAWGYGDITLSESLKNFKRIKVLATRAYSADNNTDKYSGPWCEFDCDGIANTTASWGAVTPAIYEGPYWKYSTFTANSTFNQLTWYQGGYIKITNPSDYASGTNWIDGKSVGIKAVIGINRKRD